MPGVIILRNLLVAAAAAGAALALAVTATFAAPEPGSDLEPVDGAGQLVAILQGNQTLVWTSLAGPVTWYRIEGWPVESGGNRLGGALVLERPDDGGAGSIPLAEKPRAVTFELGG